MKANLLVRGHACLWSIDFNLPKKTIDKMRADGVPIGKLVYDEKWIAPDGHPLSQHSPDDREGN